MARILILGTGNAQYDVLKRAQELGFEVYACSTPRPSHDLPFWTGYREINITDAAAVGSYAREIGADFIYSVGSDVAMPTVTQVSEELNLPHFISSETARLCNNKQLLRQHLGHDFPGNLPFCILRDEADLANVDFFPVIVKPVDSQGQRGISQCRKAEELSAAYHKALEHSRSKVVIAEKLLEEAFEISVNAYLYNGELLVFEPSDRISYSEFPGGIIKPEPQEGQGGGGRRGGASPRPRSGSDRPQGGRGQRPQGQRGERPAEGRSRRPAAAAAASSGGVARFSAESGRRRTR